jgi:RNA polymerase sigma-70 factor (ECF subfamily)
VKQSDLEDLYRRTGHLVLRRCRGILRDDAEAEDVLQEVFLRALKYERSLRRAESQLGWLYRTAERCCFDRFKLRKREVARDPDLLARNPDGGRPQSAAEARHLLFAFLGRFDSKAQQVAVLHWLDGLSQEEIAQRLGWSRRTVGKKLARLRRRAAKLGGASAGTSPGEPGEKESE